MSEKKGAYATTATDTNFRTKWDKEEYAEKAKQKDLEERERMQENEERLKQGACTESFDSYLLNHPLQAKNHVEDAVMIFRSQQS